MPQINSVQIYIPNLIKKLYNEGIEKLTEAERYLLTIILPNVDEAREIAKGFDVMEEYIQEAIKVGYDDDLREAYDKEWALKDQGYREGKEDGFQSGFNNGYQDAMKHAARNFKQSGFDLQHISEATGLSLEEISHL